MSEFSYQTLKSPVENILIKEKGSKFIGFAAAVADEEDFKTYLDDIKNQHPKATHHCYAFRLGLNGENYRANDDGEPNGSAGLPIFNQILACDITNVALVVVRYYGGTKLGVSGLIKAYKNTAKETLATADIIVKDLTYKCAISFKFTDQNEIFTLINKLEGNILSFETAENCKITAEIKSEFKAAFEQKIELLREVSVRY